uniref:Uncharacterized protein n=1 Tax=Vitis vinifera TaxID=29760 RepID=F6H3L2_VITVI
MFDVRYGLLLSVLVPVDARVFPPTQCKNPSNNPFENPSDICLFIFTIFVAYHPGVLWSHLDDFFIGFHLKDYAVSEASRDYRRLVYEFSNMGLFEKKGHGVFVTLYAMAMMFSACIYGVLGCDSTWVHLASGALMGLFWIQSGWIGHDSGHYQ